MEKQEITAKLDEIQKTLEKMNGEDVDFIFLASNQNRGVFNGTTDGIGACLLWSMTRYPVIQEIVFKVVGYYFQHKKEVDEAVENDNPSREIVDIR